MSPQARLQLPQTRDDLLMLAGGMDQVTPALAVNPGTPRWMVNFECLINGGYRRIEGYERYDGRTSPSSATYRLIPIVEFFSTPTVGQTITGNTSSTTARIIAVTSSYVVVTLIAGSGFLEGEITSVSGTVIGAVGPQTISLSNTLHKQYVNLAADVYRSLIAVVPGKGPVRGVFGAVFKGVFSVYALRDHLTSQRCPLYKATSAGWEIIMGGGAGEPVFLEFNFENGGPVPIENDTVYNGPSGPFQAYFKVRRAVLTSGSWASNTAKGKIIIDHTNSSIFAGTTYTIGQTNITILSGAAGNPGFVQFAPGGKFEFDYANFYGQLGSSRIYGCDGRNRAWEFDGEVVIPMDTDGPHIGPPSTFVEDLREYPAPTHIRAHQNHLFLAIGSSIINSGIGTPFNWSSVAGAAEHGLGDIVTGMLPLSGVQGSGAMAVTSRNHTKILYGTATAGTTPFQLVSLKTETGAIPYTLQRLDRAYYLDDRGVVDLQSAQEYGNFASATVTRLIQKYIDQKHGRAAYSVINRAKGQYRLFFNDGTGLYLTFDNGKRRGAAPVAFPVPMFCGWSGEDAAGQEVTFLGGTDGMVYQLDRGTSFDGESIDAEMLLPWHMMKTPRMRKTIHRASIEIQDVDYTELRVGARLGPAMTAHLQDLESTEVTPSELDMQWDHFTWDDFWWDHHADAPLEVDVKGTAERVQYRLASGTDYLPAYTLTSIITHYLPRRGLR